MEQSVEECLHRALQRGLFPQWADNWPAQLERARRLIPGDSEHGLKQKRVALSASEPSWFWACFYAFAARNMDIFLLNPQWGEKERSEALEIARPQWIASDASREMPIEERAIPEERESGVKGFRVMIPTGGSSGKVRFAIHDWKTLSAAVEGLRRHFDSPAISSLCMLPLYHVSGFMQTIRSALTGGKVVFSSGSDLVEGCQTLFSLAPEDRFLSLVPAQLRELMEDDLKVNYLRDFRAIFCGGGPLPNELAIAARKARLPLAPTYGMTETAAQVATLFPEEFLDGIEGQGSPLPHASIEISTTNEEIGAIGDVLIKSSSLFRGYFGETDRSDQLFVTGDRGRKDEKGRIAVVGRIGRTIISGGENIDLQEIETAFLETGLIEEVVAFGVEDKKWGESLCVAYTNVDRQDLEADLKLMIGQRLSSFKQPKSWLSLDSLPRNELGKIDLAILRKLADRG